MDDMKHQCRMEALDEIRRMMAGGPEGAEPEGMEMPGGMGEGMEGMETPPEAPPESGELDLSSLPPEALEQLKALLAGME